ncbi:MAG: Asp-tRNA(Asn) amidotransferase GatCAB subunit C [Candidatus Pacearchaeota archaeon]
MIDQNKIKKQAQEILDKFAKALEKSGIKEIDSYVDREDFERKEENGKCCDSGFKERFLKNAPVHDDDFVIAERGNWK